MNVLILGGAGMLGPYVVPLLAPHHTVRVTDIVQPSFAFEGEFREVDAASLEQVMDAAEGMDAIINLSVLRHHRKLAFDVSTLGCYNTMRAAVAHGIRRVINTGPHFTIAGPTYEYFDYDLSPDMPSQSGTNLYALSKSLGQEICQVYTENHDVVVQTYLFNGFLDPTEAESGRRHAPFSVSWQNSAEIFQLGLEVDLDTLPSKCEVFYIFTDMPHRRFRNDKAKRLLGFQPRDDISSMWMRPEHA